MTDPTVELPRGAQGGVELCHRCRHWRATETVRDLAGIPVCAECEPLPEPEPETPRKRTRKAPAKRATAKRSSR